MARMTKKMSVLTTRPARKAVRLAPLNRPGTIRDLDVPYAGFVPGKRDTTTRHFRGYGISFVASGEGRILLPSGGETRVPAGSAFFLPPGRRICFGPRPGTSWDEYYVGVLGPGTERLLGYGWLPRGVEVQPLVQTGPVVDAFQRLLKAMDRAGPHDYDLAILHAELLLFEIHCARADVKERVRQASGLAGVLRYLERHYPRDVDFSALARENSMSYSLLRQRLRAVTGLPPAKYLTKLRCEAAASFLLDSDLPVKRVADEVGISDPYAFSKVFKRHAGLSPRAFRARRRK